MTRYLLDTNVLTELEDRHKPGFALVAARLAGLKDADEVYLSILSVYEYRHGISRAPEELKESLVVAWKAFEERLDRAYHRWGGPLRRAQNSVPGAYGRQQQTAEVVHGRFHPCELGARA